MKQLIHMGLGATAALGLLTPLTQHRVQATQVPTLTAEQLEILSHLSLIDPADDPRVGGRTIRFSGVNVQIVNGLEATNGNPGDPYTAEPGFTWTDGLGNLIVGYQESRQTVPVVGYQCNGLADALQNADIRTGSHNIIVGDENNYDGFGGVVFGDRNWSSGAWATVTGGYQNYAKGARSSVSGGQRNIAEGGRASISGGLANGACGTVASVAGGTSNIANGSSASVAGGMQNQANGSTASVGGGFRNQSNGNQTAVAGGSEVTVTSAFHTGSGTLKID